ncbi:MAG: membrane protein insertion efficiency factor YidD [Candidatus Acidiferrales bacterium]
MPGSSDSMQTRERSWGVWVSLALVQFYRTFLSHFFGGACKFYPSCSKYAQEAIARHGARRGIVLALKRLGRCRPFTEGGFDPVPDIQEAETSGTRNTVTRNIPPANSRMAFNARLAENVLRKHDEERIL